MITKKIFTITIVAILVVLNSCEDPAYYKKSIINNTDFDVVVLTNKKNFKVTEPINDDSIYLLPHSEIEISKENTEPDFGEYKSFDMFKNVIVKSNDTLVVNKDITLKENWLSLISEEKTNFKRVKRYKYVFEINNSDIVNEK